MKEDSQGKKIGDALPGTISRVTSFVSKTRQGGWISLKSDTEKKIGEKEEPNEGPLLPSSEGTEKRNSSLKQRITVLTRGKSGKKTLSRSR